MVMPIIADARHVGSYVIGPHLAMVFTDCTSVGHVQYTHILFVYEIDPDNMERPRRRLMAVAAEVNENADCGGGSHFLGVFTGGHLNMGSSDEWADLDRFTEKALQIAAQHLNISDPPLALT